ncbi:MAG TPA: DUF4162 domain-containing protein, partial [Candidatus Thermoplasmatota archaeon]|nr:DUF4162 domain-containing protein [Candidatus Thermoplasmatota archaeon]
DGRERPLCYLDHGASTHAPRPVLDEPSTGLDPKSRSDLWTVLRRLRKERGITIVMSTHYMDEADVLCDRIAIIDRGRIAAIDTPASLKRSVGADRLVIKLAAAPTEAQRRSLAQGFGAANVSLDNGSLTLRVRDGGRALMPALQKVTTIGLGVQETRVLTPTLDDVFLKYTGARLEESEAKATAAAAEARKGGHAARRGGHS